VPLEFLSSKIQYLSSNAVHWRVRRRPRNRLGDPSSLSRRPIHVGKKAAKAPGPQKASAQAHASRYRAPPTITGPSSAHVSATVPTKFYLQPECASLSSLDFDRVRDTPWCPSFSSHRGVSCHSHPSQHPAFSSLSDSSANIAPQSLIDVPVASRSDHPPTRWLWPLFWTNERCPGEVECVISASVLSFVSSRFFPRPSSVLEQV
jgi:hypothetical protein